MFLAIPYTLGRGMSTRISRRIALTFLVDGSKRQDKSTWVVSSRHHFYLVEEKGQPDMTMKRVEEIECPKCGRKQTETLYETINVTLNHDLKQKLFEGEINRFRCKSCGNEAYISLPLLYHDMGRKYCVQYYPFD